MALSSGFSRGRRLLGAAEGLGTVAVVGLLVAAVVFTASRPALRQRWDLTDLEAYTLSEQTRTILGDLAAPVEIVSVLGAEVQAMPVLGLREAQERAIAYVRNLLEEYEVAARGRVSLRHLVPHLDVVEIKDLVRTQRLARTNVVLLTSGGRTRQVFLDELVTIDRGFSDAGGYLEPAELRAFHGEGPLTSALLEVTSEQPPRLGFLTGHGEDPVDVFDGLGAGLFAEALRGQGFDVVQVDLFTSGALPDDLDVVVLLGPEKALSRRDVEALEAWQAEGGAVLVTLKPWVDDPELTAWLERLGLLYERNLITREDAPLMEASQRTIIPVRRFTADHPVSAPIARQGTFAMFPSTGSLGRAPDTPAHVATPVLAVSEPAVFGDRLAGPETLGNFSFDEGQEVRAPRNLAMAVEGRGGRVVAFAGSAFLNNSFLQSAQGGPGNMDLGLNAANWLARRESAVASRPRTLYESRVDLFEDESQRVFLYVVVGMPLAGALLGAVIWFLRRR